MERANECLEGHGGHRTSELGRTVNDRVKQQLHAATVRERLHRICERFQDKAIFQLRNRRTIGWSAV
jgi:hypothetical protein